MDKEKKIGELEAELMRLERKLFVTQVAISNLKDKVATLSRDIDKLQRFESQLEEQRQETKKELESTSPGDYCSIIKNARISAKGKISREEVDNIFETIKESNIILDKLDA